MSYDMPSRWMSRDIRHEGIIILNHSYGVIDNDLQSIVANAFWHHSILVDKGDDSAYAGVKRHRYP